jgi:hypothetical protein
MGKIVVGRLEGWWYNVTIIDMQWEWLLKQGMGERMGRER